MKQPCDTVVERIATGEELGNLAEHTTGCAACKALVALPLDLTATHREIDPGLGFSARMTAGAQHRIGVRRRNRIAGGLALAMVAATFGVIVMTRHTEPAAPLPATADQVRKDAPADPGEVAADARMLRSMDRAETWPVEEA